MSLSNKLYKLGRRLNKAATVARDIEVLATGDKDIIKRRVRRKLINKTAFSVTKEITKNIK